MDPETTIMDSGPDAIVRHEDPLLADELARGEVRECVCGALLQKDGGCNYLQCRSCAIEWCWMCRRIKRVPGGCDDPTHNSH